MPHDWPLTGRADHLARAAAALREHGGVVLSGPAGVGKTRLAREVLAEASRHGRLTRWIGATESSRGIPLGAFAAQVAEAGDTEQAGLLGRIASVLHEDVEILGLDDAHLLDDVSATLLHQLAIERTIQLVVTVRWGEPTPDAVTALWKDGLIERLDLPALSAPETRRLLEAVLDGPLEGAGSRRLFAVTRGNVQLLRHLVLGERQAGRLVRQDGLWRWTGKPRLTPALRDLIDDRIGPLSVEERRLLELVALAEPVEIGLLTALAGHSVVEAAAQRGLIEVEFADRRLIARSGHPLYSEAVRERTDPLRARRHRSELASALAATGARRTGDTLRRAVLALDSAAPKDPTLLTAAATQAAELADWRLTERLLRAANDAGGGFESRLALGLTLSWAIRPEEAEVELRRAGELARDSEQRARVAIPRAVNRFVLLLARGTRASKLPSAGASTRHDPLWSQYQAAPRALFAAIKSRLAEALDYGNQVLNAPSPPEYAVPWAGYGVAIAHALTGRVSQLGSLVDRVVTTEAQAPETALLRFNLRYWLVYGLGLAGLPGQAERGQQRWIRDLPGQHTTLARDAIAGRLALDRGEARTAAALLSGVCSSFPEHAGGWTTLLAAGIAQALGMAGDARSARAALLRAERSECPGLRCFLAELPLARAWVAAAEGAVGQAMEQARRAGELAEAASQWAVEVVARHTAVCFGDPQQADRLAELAARVEGPRAPAAAAHAAALAQHDPEALLAASAMLERAELVLPAADAAAQAAALLRGKGQSSSAAFANARATALAERCDGARTPALRAGTTPLPISIREREVAMLAATGLSNREIATRLHVSVRTVEGHIYRACTRLGLRDRAALAALVTTPDSASRA